MKSIDVVIPTASSPSNLASIAAMQLPARASVNYYIVTDGPPGAIRNNYSSNMKFIRNAGSGAHTARNTGIEAGTGEYVLFIDDDVIPIPDLLLRYKDAIERWPDSTGFIGTVNFPQPRNPFEKGVVSSDILTFFGIAKTRKESAWGVTANLLVKREAVGPTRFSEAFPGHGGGEDIDFCLRIVQRTCMKFMTVGDAVVDHPWWGGGTRQYRRFARWAYGDSQLPKLHASYRYLNFPNMVETGTIGAVVFLVLGLIQPRFMKDAAVVVVSAFLTECAWESVKAIRRGEGSFRTGIESALVRLSNEIGRMFGNFMRGHFGGVCERFDYFTTGESIPHERRAAASKIVVFTVLVAVLALFIS